jgi:hypothetical protein
MQNWTSCKGKQFDFHEWWIGSELITWCHESDENIDKGENAFI